MIISTGQGLRGSDMHLNVSSLDPRQFSSGQYYTTCAPTEHTFAHMYELGYVLGAGFGGGDGRGRGPAHPHSS
jgi:hypothetical protein